ncbi:MAG: NADH-quinone oxidoreductase subunit N [Nitrospirota bacterium]
MISLPIPIISAIYPEVVLTIFALLVIVSDLFLGKERKDILAYLSIAGLVIATILTVRGIGGGTINTFSGMFVLDDFSAFFKIIFYVTSALSILISIRYLKIEEINKGEYYAMILLSTVGMMIMASGSDLISIYLGLELMALSVYILAGFMRKSIRSNEAALKYFVLGCFSSGIFLYGVSLLYGITGTTNIKEIATIITINNLSTNPALFLAVILVGVGFCFKIAAVPFHMWVPDVYEGAPTSITAFMSVGPKAAAFVALIRVLIQGLNSITADWSLMLSVISILTMAVGNILAIVQSNIKRMLAYSSIAHAGYALIGVVAGGQIGVSAVAMYLAIYIFMNIGAFAIVIMLRNGVMLGEEINDFTGLAKKNRLAALFMLIFMFSLTGLPPTAGFIGKFYVFMAAIKAGYLWLVVAGVIFSAISAYFYLRVVMVMYMKEPQAEFNLAASPALNVALLISVAAVIAFGIFPFSLIELAWTSVSVLF